MSFTKPAGRTVAVLFILAVSSSAQAQSWTDMVSFSGFLESDTRFILEDYRGALPGQGHEFEMNRNDVQIRLGVQPNASVRGVIDGRLRYFGFNEAATLPELVNREAIDPLSVQLDEAYVMAREVIWESMDLKVGRMVQNWGAADQFNPTDNLNSRDFSDPMDYARKVPNQMMEMDLYPSDWLSLSLVWVPLFKPAQLPPSAVLGFAVEYEEDGKFKQAPLPPLPRQDMKDLQEMFGLLDPYRLEFVDPEIRTVRPENTIENSQAAVKANLLLGPLDMNLSYYYGRFGFPVAYTAAALVTTDPDDKSITNVKYIAEVMYPRMHVAGFDFSYSANWFFDVGFVGEVALFFPEEVTFALRAFQGDTLAVDRAAVNVRSEPFVKGTFGFDYTFTSWLYINCMYVRGFFDEFNDAYGLHNYGVAATELKFLDDELKIRLAGIMDIDDHSASVTPMVTWIVFPSAQLIASGMWFFGDTDPADPLDYASKYKFGQKAVGRNVVSLKAKLTW